MLIYYRKKGLSYNSQEHIIPAGLGGMQKLSTKVMISTLYWTFLFAGIDCYTERITNDIFGYGFTSF